MLVRLYLEPYFLHFALWIDQESVPRGICRVVVGHHGIILCGNLLLRIGQELEAETLFGAKLLVRVLVLHADSDDHRILLLVLRQVALEIVRFDRAPGREVLG